MSLSLITPPAAPGLVVTVGEVHEHCRIDHTEDDVYLTSLIQAAQAHLEGRTGWLNRALLTSTWDQSFGSFPFAWSPPDAYSGALRLGLSPVTAITSVKYLDPGGLEQTLDSALYQADLKAEPAYLLPAFGKTWPAIRCDVVNAVTVRFVAGYGTLAAVPPPIKLAILGLVAYWYEQREAVAVGAGVTTALEVPLFVTRLLDNYRVYG